MGPPAIDVIVPCYNYGRYLRGCVGSVLDETSLAVRVLIIDDASADGSGEEAERIAASDARVQVIRHAVNRGHIATYNEGIDWVRADYMLLLSADDMVAPGALARAVELMQRHPQIAFVYGRAVHFSSEEELGAVHLRADGEPVIRPGQDFIGERCRDPVNPVETVTAVVRTSVQKAVGGYSPELPHAGDLEMWLRCAARGDVGIISAVQGFVRLHDRNMRKAYPLLADDLQRFEAFRRFFDGDGRRLPRSKALRKEVTGRLAGDLFCEAANAFDNGRPYSERLAAALAMQPSLLATRPYLKLTAKRILRRIMGERPWSRRPPSRLSTGSGAAPPAACISDNDMAGGPIRLLFCCDPDYYQHLAVALTSLLDSNRRNSLEIHLITGTRSPRAEEALLSSIEGYDNVLFDIHEFTWPDKGDWHTSGHITAETYTRIFCPHVLDAAIDKILYLDADLVVVDDLAPLWNTNIDSVALAAVADPFGIFRRDALGMPGWATYINAGVLLINLKRWREDDIPRRLADYIRRQGRALEFHDQDAINAVLFADTMLLDARWNLQARAIQLGRRRRGPWAELRKAAQSPGVIHYASRRKPWMFAAAMPKKGLYWRYLKRTAWRGASPSGRRLSAYPESLLNAFLLAIGSEADWQDIAESPRMRVFRWWRRRLSEELRKVAQGPAARRMRAIK